MEECVMRNLLTQADDALSALHDAKHRGFSFNRLRRMEQSLLDMNWIGEDEFNVFIDEVAAIRTANESEDAQEVTDADFDLLQIVLCFPLPQSTDWVGTLSRVK